MSRFFDVADICASPLQVLRNLQILECKVCTKSLQNSWLFRAQHFPEYMFGFHYVTTADFIQTNFVSGSWKNMDIFIIPAMLVLLLSNKVINTLTQFYSYVYKMTSLRSLLRVNHHDSFSTITRFLESPKIHTLHLSSG